MSKQTKKTLKIRYEIIGCDLHTFNELLVTECL